MKFAPIIDPNARKPAPKPVPLTNCVDYVVGQLWE